MDILPDGTTNPASILQQSGRGRYEVSFDGFTTSYADYKTLHADAIALTQRTWADGTDSITMIISYLSPAVMIMPGKWEYSITLMEANMRTIPSAVQTLLKSRSMIGANKPSTKRPLRVWAAGITPETPTMDNTRLWFDSNGNFKLDKKTDGGYMCCWVDGTTLELQTGFSSNLDFLTNNYAIESAVSTDSITALVANVCVLYKRTDNKVLLIMLTGRGANCYISKQRKRR